MGVVSVQDVLDWKAVSRSQWIRSHPITTTYTNPQWIGSSTLSSVSCVLKDCVCYQADGQGKALGGAQANSHAGIADSSPKLYESKESKWSSASPCALINALCS